MTGEPGRRIFIAVPLDTAVAASVRAVVERVRRAEERDAPDERPVRWVNLEGLHLTLKFLGATAEERLAAVREAVDESADGVEPIAIRIAGAGGFPSPGRPRALWLGIAEGAQPLAELAGRLDRALHQRGWQPDTRPFRAHLTLARSDGVRRGAATVRRLIDEAAGLDAGWTADRVVVFQSHLGRGPAQYQALHTASLRG